MSYIREHLKGFIGITILTVCTIVLIVSSELIAVMLPDANDLTFEGTVSEFNGKCVYTGEEIIPEFSTLIFSDEAGRIVEVEQDDYVIDACYNNIEIGYADMEVSLEGYRNSVLIEDAFQIVVGQTEMPEITKTGKKQITFKWDSVAGADGYIVYRSTDHGGSYNEFKRYDADTLECTNKKMAFNKTYMYYVTAYAECEHGIEYGEPSEVLTYVTPLKTAEASEVIMVNSNTLQVSWNKVKGASGYQVYRCLEADGDFELIKEINKNKTTSYKDDTCEVGVAYYYYVAACQTVGDEVRIGENSNVVSGSTIPETASMSGTTNDSKTKAVLKWNQVDQADGYEIYKSTGSSYSLFATVSESVLSVTDSDLVSGKRYTYKVRAYKEVNGEKVYGEFSETYTKAEKINYNYTNTAAGEFAGVVNYADTSYVPGGSSTSGWDCSGFTRWALKTYAGIDIPQGAYAQGLNGTAISVSDRSQWKAGDILCYTENGSSVSHVALYLGNGQLMHAINEKYDTLIQSVDYYESWDSATRLVGVRRYN